MKFYIISSMAPCGDTVCLITAATGQYCGAVGRSSAIAPAPRPRPRAPPESALQPPQYLSLLHTRGVPPRHSGSPAFPPTGNSLSAAFKSKQTLRRSVFWQEMWDYRLWIRTLTRENGLECKVLRDCGIIYLLIILQYIIYRAWDYTFADYTLIHNISQDYVFASYH